MADADNHELIHPNDAIKAIKAFVEEHQIDCPRALERLLRTGVPATVIHNSSDDRGDTVIVAETVQHFITAMDAVKLESFAVDELHPLLADVMQSLSRMRALPADMQGKAKVRATAAR